MDLIKKFRVKVLAIFILIVALLLVFIFSSSSYYKFSHNTSDAVLKSFNDLPREGDPLCVWGAYDSSYSEDNETDQCEAVSRGEDPDSCVLGKIRVETSRFISDKDLQDILDPYGLKVVTSIGEGHDGFMYLGFPRGINLSMKSEDEWKIFLSDDITQGVDIRRTPIFPHQLGDPNYKPSYFARIKLSKQTTDSELKKYAQDKNLEENLFPYIKGELNYYLVDVPDNTEVEWSDRLPCLSGDVYSVEPYFPSSWDEYWYEY